MTRVDELAHVRAGDKGDHLILGVVPWDQEAYDQLAERLTPERVARAYRPLVTGPVQRSCLPELPALIFTLPGVLGAGVTGSPVLDGHGKTLSYHLLTVEI
ncbi:AtuA-related protein [Janibacter cremeus]|uniref:AtuA-like ferredoxin-fold domain-containing protein n=1 Tax=Janibacter cremeus TaxID=1285192 RepID=A0A852VTL5_9MICO|nr:hypothetical protein [Janibacter cremeus]NYF99686.1 hypothetical protein [Janibacter cremeus]